MRQSNKKMVGLNKIVKDFLIQSYKSFLKDFVLVLISAVVLFFIMLEGDPFIFLNFFSLDNQQKVYAVLLLIVIFYLIQNL